MSKARLQPAKEWDATQEGWDAAQDVEFAFRAKRCGYKTNVETFSVGGTTLGFPLRWDQIRA